ncbi:MAG: hypothetical protein ACOYOH_13065, partial [Paracraurococcus sp.]
MAAALIAAMAARGLLGGASGWLKKKWGVDELITSFLASNAVIPLIWVNALVPGLVAAWAILGLPGLPQLRRPRPPQPEPGAA